MGMSLSITEAHRGRLWAVVDQVRAAGFSLSDYEPRTEPPSVVDVAGGDVQGNGITWPQLSPVRASLVATNPTESMDTCIRPASSTSRSFP
jgi:hypothetical protein